MQGLNTTGATVAVLAAIATTGCEQRVERSATPSETLGPGVEENARQDAAPDASLGNEGREEGLLESLSGEIRLSDGEFIGTIDLSGGNGTVYLQPPGMGNGDVMLSAQATRVGERDIELSLTAPYETSAAGTLSLTERSFGRPAGTLTFMGETWDVEVPVIAALEAPIRYDAGPGNIGDIPQDELGIGMTGRR